MMIQKIFGKGSVEKRCTKIMQKGNAKIMRYLSDVLFQKGRSREVL
jgi:hypothetical protein